MNATPNVMKPNRPPDGALPGRNTSADKVELWFSYQECFALVTVSHRRSHNDHENTETLYLITRRIAHYRNIPAPQWQARKIEKDSLSMNINALNKELSLEIDRQYNEWRMSNAIEEAMCPSSSTNLT